MIAKDTPNFIANRVGTFSMLNALRMMAELGMTIEEVDACTGPAVGWPKSATFRTADIVGIDVLAHVVRNLYENVPGDESREIFKLPPVVEELLKRGWLGEKSGRGFYQRVKKGGESEILTLDPQTMEYRPKQKARFGSIDAARTIENTGREIASAARSRGDRAGRRQSEQIFVGRNFAHVSLRRAPRSRNF